MNGTCLRSGDSGDIQDQEKNIPGCSMYIGACSSRDATLYMWPPVVWKIAVGGKGGIRKKRTHSPSCSSS